jgi:hypothetical protein
MPKLAIEKCSIANRKVKFAPRVMKSGKSRGGKQHALLENSESEFEDEQGKDDWEVLVGKGKQKVEDKPKSSKKPFALSAKRKMSATIIKLSEGDEGKVVLYLAFVNCY